MLKNVTIFAIVFCALFIPAHAMAATIGITEWMYNGNGDGSVGEFVEFTNLTSTAIDMTGWSFDDNSRVAGSESLSAFGIVQPGESVVLTDIDASIFRTQWNLSSAVKIIGNNSNNLGRNDEINLYDNTNTLIDRLTYNDQGTGTVKGPRTNGTSANPSKLAFVGTNNASQWVLSTVGDPYGSYSNSLSEIGNPGKIPEPSSILLLLAGGLGFAFFHHCRK